MEMEENYTQELMASEQKMNEVQARLRQVEDRAKQTSTVYTSNRLVNILSTFQESHLMKSVVPLCHSTIRKGKTVEVFILFK